MAKFLKSIVGIEEEGYRLDRFLAGCPGIVSRGAAQLIIESGKATISGRVHEKDYRIKIGDVVLYELPTKNPPTVRPQILPIDIIFEDKHILVVNKPANQVVHPAPGNYEGTLVNAMLAHGRLASIGSPLRPGIVHRLDKGTSGLIVAAKTDEAYMSLVKQLKDRQVGRKYLALVEGNFKDPLGRIEAPIKRSQGDRKQMTVGRSNAKKAVTGFAVISTMKGLSLLEVTLETGRTHQIRVHMKFINHPIVGDPTYGSSKSKYRDLKRPWLHAFKLNFTHPESGRLMSFEREPPPELIDFLKRVGFKVA